MRKEIADFVFPVVRTAIEYKEGLRSNEGVWRSRFGECQKKMLALLLAHRGPRTERSVAVIGRVVQALVDGGLEGLADLGEDLGLVVVGGLVQDQREQLVPQPLAAAVVQWQTLDGASTGRSSTTRDGASNLVGAPDAALLLTLRAPAYVPMRGVLAGAPATAVIAMAVAYPSRCR